jgi:O-antigen/teichoic acid export membrane protein/glycosyltransferase involved in cell wall biosynthesis
MAKSQQSQHSHWPLVALSLIPAFLGVLLPLILVRILTPAEVGTFKIFFLYLSIAPALLLTSGLRSGLAYWAGNESKRTPAMQLSANLLLLIALAGTVLILAVQGHVSGRLSTDSRDTYLFALSLLGAVAGCYFEEAAIATGRVWRGALFYSCWEVARTAAIVAVLFYYRSIAAVLVAHTALSSLKLMAGYWHGYRLGLVGFPSNISVLKEVWGYALPVSCAYVFGIFIASADQFLLASLISPSEFALYSIGCLSLAPLFTYEQSVTRVLIPQMSEAFSNKQPRRAALLYQSAVDNLGFILIPAVTGLVIFATPVIELLFTTRYSNAASYLQIFGLSYLLLIIPYDALARARGNAKWILQTFIIFAAISLLLSYTLITVTGPLGALVGVLISGVALRLYSLNYSCRELSLRLQDVLPGRACLYYLCISLTVGCAALLSRSAFSSSRTWLFVNGTIFLLTYLLLALPVKNRAARRRGSTGGVLCLTQSLHVGGLEKMVLHLSHQLRKEHGWRIRILAYDHQEDKRSLVDEFEKAGVPVEFFQKSPGFSLPVILRIIKAVYRHDISILHSQDLGTLIYAAFAKVGSFGRVSIVHTQHSFPSQESTLRYRIYRRLFSQGIDQLAVVSKDIFNQYSHCGIKTDRLHLVENGVAFPPEAVIKRHTKISLRSTVLDTISAEDRALLMPFLSDIWILYQARLYPGKGQDHALSVWTQMRDEDRRRSVLCFVGPESKDGELFRLECLKRSAPDHERIFMLGATAVPLQWLQASDIFLSCSEYEGMPLAPLEAAGSGLPILLSRIPGHAFLNDIALQYPLEDYRQGADHMKTLIKNVTCGGEQYHRHLWQESHAIRERFSISHMAQRYSELYEKCDPRDQYDKRHDNAT